MRQREKFEPALIASPAVLIVLSPSCNTPRPGMLSSRPGIFDQLTPLPVIRISNKLGSSVPNNLPKIHLFVLLLHV